MVDLAQDLRSPPEGLVAEGALVVKPSLWAGIGMLAEVLGFLFPVAVPLFASLVFSGAIDIDASNWDSGPAWFVLFDRIEFVAAILLAFGPVVKVAFTRYTFDDEGIRVRTQLLSRTDQKVGWEKVTALRHRRGLLDRWFGIARLDVIAYGERGATLHLVGLRDAPGLRDLVARRMRERASVEGLFRSD